MVVSLTDYPDVPTVSFRVNLEVTCPDMHTFAGIVFKNTVVDVPLIYYDMNVMLPLVVPMNQWSMEPSNPPNVVCFTITQHAFIDMSDNSQVSYITLNDFNNGLVEIVQTDPAFTGLTKTYEWRIDIDDGTTDMKMQEFQVEFITVNSCAETSLQQGWAAAPALTQKAFETNIQY